LYVDRLFELTADYYAGENFSISLFFGSQSIIPSLFEKPVFTVYNSSITTVGAGLRYDTRDDPISPTRGINFFSSFSLLDKKINGPAEFITVNQILQVSLKKVIFDFDMYIEIFSRNILTLGLSVKEIQGDFLEESDLFKLGGNSSLRGYREEQFRGNRIAWSNIEYRYLVSKRSFLFAFFDTGYYLLSGDEQRKIVEQSGTKMGYGFGMSFETGIGLLSVSYAIASGEGFNNGKIHFGIINQF
jgi:outer membrane protein insertion porin family